MASLARACIDASIAAYVKKSWSSDNCEALAVTLPGNIFGIAFRGTASLHDAVWDMRVIPWRHHTLGLVHTGFSDGVDAIWPAILASMPDKDMAIAFTGHSKGGAEATLCAALAVERGYLVKHLITFGSPRVAASGKVLDILARGGVNILRYVNRGDPVPRVPPWFFGYRHVGLAIEIGEDWDIASDHPAIAYKQALRLQ